MRGHRRDDAQRGWWPPAISAASGIGSCLGTCSACFSVISALPPYASDTISVSSSMM